MAWAAAVNKQTCEGAVLPPCETAEQQLLRVCEEMAKLQGDYDAMAMEKNTAVDQNQKLTQSLQRIHDAGPLAASSSAGQPSSQMQGLWPRRQVQDRRQMQGLWPRRLRSRASVLKKGPDRSLRHSGLGCNMSILRRKALCVRLR